MPYTPVLATLGYVLHPDGRQVLMLRRSTRPDDHHQGRYVGLGGKLERDEDVVACMRREIREEAGLEASELELRGTISWPGFGKGGQDWFAFVFVIRRFAGEPRGLSDEGELLWVGIDALLAWQVPIWDGDKHFLPLLFASPPAGQFHAVIPYQDGRARSFDYSIC